MTVTAISYSNLASNIEHLEGSFRLLVTIFLNDNWLYCILRLSLKLLSDFL